MPKSGNVGLRRTDSAARCGDRSQDALVDGHHSDHRRNPDAFGSPLSVTTRLSLLSRHAPPCGDSSQTGTYMSFGVSSSGCHRPSWSQFWSWAITFSITCSSESMNCRKSGVGGKTDLETQAHEHVLRTCHQDEARQPAKTKAPGPLLRVLEALQELEVNVTVLPFGRVYAWLCWIRAWGSSRFDDHRCLEPALLKRTPQGLSDVFESETHGPHRGAERKPMFLDKNCWLAERIWLDVGPQLLQQMALHERDSLLPSPSANYGGNRGAELSVDGSLPAMACLHRSHNRD